MKAIGASDGVYTISCRYPRIGILSVLDTVVHVPTTDQCCGDGGVAGGGLCTMRSLLGEVYFPYIGCTGHGGRMIRMWTAVVVLQ